jgi:hypothetical protein
MYSCRSEDATAAKEHQRRLRDKSLLRGSISAIFTRRQTKGKLIDISFYHCTYLELNTGDTIQSGNWGRKIFETGPRHPSWKREMMLEVIRAEYYPDKPSRLYSCFGCHSLESIKFYKAQHCPDGFIYEVEYIEPDAAIHKGDFNAVQHLLRAEFNAIQMAHLYWQYKFKTSVTDFEHIECSEFVTLSRLRVIQKL